MVSKEERLPYRDLYIPGYKVFRSQTFTLKIKNNTLKTNRFGVIIAKSTEKTSVRRNFWKRQAKALFKDIPNCSRDFVLIFTPKIAKTKVNDFKKEFLINLKAISL